MNFLSICLAEMSTDIWDDNRVFYERGCNQFGCCC